jgi:hypothetical protein
MALEEVVSLEADVTYSLGKLNKKTGKTDPKSVEGYYLGSRKVATKLGDSLIHFFKTQRGNVGVWGSGDLNRKLQNIRIGTMTKVEFIGMKDTPRGEMRSFKVYQDKNNTIEVEINVSAPVEYSEDFEDTSTDSDSDDALSGSDDEPYLPAGQAQVQLSAVERAAKVQALLKNKKK